MLEKFIAEIIGTFIFLGVIITSTHSSSKYVDSFAWIKIGLALSICILLVGFISGPHLNPVVSFMFFLNKDIDIKELFIYIVAQIIGSILAYLYYLFLKNNYKSLFINKN